MTQPRRDTKYARELASARLPSGPKKGKAAAAIERLFVKQTEQEEIRFSWWEGSRMMPRALDLPEEELLPLLKAAIDAGVFSDTFVKGLRALLGGSARDEAAEGDPPADRSRPRPDPLPRADPYPRRHAARDDDGPLPTLTAGVETEEQPGSFAVAAMDGGFKYWWDPASSKLRLMTRAGRARWPAPGSCTRSRRPARASWAKDSCEVIVTAGRAARGPGSSPAEDSRSRPMSRRSES